MVNRNLIRTLDLDSEEEWQQELNEALEAAPPEELEWGTQEVAVNQIVQGRVLRTEGDVVLVDVGYKSEGIIFRSEWEEGEELPKPGQMIKVLIEDVEDIHGLVDDSRGMITLSKRKAEKIEAWMSVMDSVHEGDVVTGVATRKIKGGLLVDIGVPVFLPASQVDIRRPADIGDYIGRTIQSLVLKIDEARRNIVVSRRALIEAERAEKKAQLLAELEVGQRRKGVVKNIADFGAFVDLGGIDGLLHITDMSWGRINHPSEMVAIDQEIEVQILHIDYEKEKIALGLKQKSPSPWENVPAKYPVGKQIKGTVVNVMSYGAFVKLEEGIEGLVHISEMSWTRRISHPSELVQVDDEIEVVVLKIDKEKHEISLGMKQTQENPWDRVADRYPPGAVVKGTVRNLTNYGAFIEIEEGIDGLLHVSDMSWTRKISHPNEMVEKGQVLECRVLSRRSGTPPHRAGHEATCRRSLGDQHPREVSARPDRQGPGHEDHQFRRLRRPGRRPGGPACTSRNWPTTRSRTPRTWSRSARRSRSRSCASMPTSGRSAFPGSGSSGPRKTAPRVVKVRLPLRPSRTSTPPAELKGGVGGGSGPLIAPRMISPEGEGGG